MRVVAAALCLALAACGQAPDGAPAGPATPTSGLRIENAWASPTPGGVDVSAGYLAIINDAAEEDVLTGATSPRAALVEVHEMAMQDGVMQMRSVARLAAPAGEATQLAPGGRHLMFYGVTQPFSEGETIPVQLMFERAGTVDVSLPVRRPGVNGASHSDH